MSFEPISDKIIYRGKVFDLVKTKFRLPNGVVLNFDLVKHSGAVVVIPVDERRNILFVRQFRIGAEQALLELPAGLLEQGEDPQACASRETREETGMAPRNLEKLGEFFMVPGYSTEKMQVFLASGLYESSLPTDEDEFIEQIAIPVEEAYAMAHTGKLLDGKTLAALLLAQPRLLPGANHKP